MHRKYLEPDQIYGTRKEMKGKKHHLQEAIEHPHENAKKGGKK
jgi:hypothetical protein